VSLCGTDYLQATLEATVFDDSENTRLERTTFVSTVESSAADHSAFTYHESEPPEKLKALLESVSPELRCSFLDQVRFHKEMILLPRRRTAWREKAAASLSIPFERLKELASTLEWDVSIDPSGD
jgi:hypothetical protein